MQTKKKKDIGYLVIKTVYKNLKCNCTSEALAASVDTWNALHDSQAVQVLWNSTFAMNSQQGYGKEQR